MEMHNNKQQHIQVGLRLITLTVAAMACSTAYALPQGEAESFPVGGGHLYPHLGVDVAYNDNIHLQDTNETSSMVTVISPGAKLEFKGDITEVALDFIADYGTYEDSHDDDYIDTSTTASIAFYPTERLSFSGALNYTEGHEARGTGSQVGGAATAFSSPDEYHTWTVNAGFKYGLDQVGAPRFEVDASHSDREFENNRSVTRFQDRETDRLNATFFYKIMPSTSLLLEGTFTDFDYDRGTLDSEQYRLLAGLTWEATYQTSGFLKVGWGKKEFDSSSRDDDSSLAWEIGVDWRPLSYSTVNLTTSQDFAESDGIGDHIDTRNISITWDHEWSSFIGSSIQLSATNDEYANSDREDDLKGFKASVEYLMEPWLRFGVSYSHSERDSDVTGLDYNSNVIGAYMIVN